MLVIDRCRFTGTGT